MKKRILRNIEMYKNTARTWGPWIIIFFAAGTFAVIKIDAST